MDLQCPECGHVVVANPQLVPACPECGYSRGLVPVAAIREHERDRWRRKAHMALVAGILAGLLMLASSVLHTRDLGLDFDPTRLADSTAVASIVVAVAGIGGGFVVLRGTPREHRSVAARALGGLCLGLLVAATSVLLLVKF